MILETPKQSDPSELLDYMPAGQEFSAARTSDRVWDRCTPSTRVERGTVNLGNGFEETLTVPVESGGFMVYRAPFVIETIPDDEHRLTFLCEDYFFIHPTKDLS